MTVTVTVDTSVVVAAFATWHTDHDVARAALARHPTVIGHVLVETYSVLTRLPEPQRASPVLVANFLSANFGTESVTLAGSEVAALVARLVTAGVSGGATYDGLIALTAAEHGLVVLTLDRRAVPTYRSCGAAFELISGAD